MIVISRMRYPLNCKMYLKLSASYLTFLFKKFSSCYFLRQVPSFTSGEGGSTFGVGMGRPVGGGGLPGMPISDPGAIGRPGPVGSDIASNGRAMGYGNQLPLDAMPRPGRDTVPLPPDASNTLYVEGLPSDSKRREVARILIDIF